jgi:hypothetical protein
MITYSSVLPDLAVPVLTDTEVLDRVRCLVDEDAWRRRSLWLMFLTEDGTQLPVLVPIDDVPERPEPEMVESVCHMVAQLTGDASEGRSVVATLSRPGSLTPSDSDRYWVRTLHHAARKKRVGLRMMCLGAEPGVCQLPLGTSG